jgi:phosphoesterase RecJ-like protein
VERTDALKKIAELIKDREQFLVTSHVDPDGDNIGAQLALFSLLEDLGKRVVVIDPSPVPERYRFLPGWERIQVVKEALPGPLRHSPDVCFVLDAGHWDRIGEVAGLVPVSSLIVNLDHHEVNPGFGSIALVDPEASSTCELLYDLFGMIGRKPSPGQATCLYTGILTDTGGFRNPNTSPRALEVAAALVRDRADPAWIWDQVWGQLKPSRLLLLGQVLSSLKISGNGQIGTFTLSREDWQRIGAKLEESEDFISHAMGVRGVRVAVFVRERGDGLIRVSLRSRDGVDVNRIAAEFGGGGHPRAAGFRLPGSLREVKRKTLEAVAGALGVPLEEDFHE